MIRDFAPDDLESLQKLLSSTPEAAQWPPDEFLNAGQKGIQVRVAEEEGEFCGFVVFRITADEMEILNLAVTLGRRRRGVGSHLLEDAMGKAKASGARKVLLEVRESNEGGRKFYSQMGFAEAGRRRQYYRDPLEDGLVLARTVEQVRENP